MSRLVSVFALLCACGATVPPPPFTPPLFSLKQTRSGFVLETPRWMQVRADRECARLDQRDVHQALASFAPCTPTK
jgi:hypothetical protein